MKRAKLIGIGIGIAILAILVFVNLDLFKTRIFLAFPFIWSVEKGTAPEIYNGIFLAAFFALGFLLKLVLGLPGMFATRKNVKALNEEVRTLQAQLAAAGLVQAPETPAAPPQESA